MWSLAVTPWSWGGTGGLVQPTNRVHAAEGGKKLSMFNVQLSFVVGGCVFGAAFQEMRRAKRHLK
jgi:hypothetical protein